MVGPTTQPLAGHHYIGVNGVGTGVGNPCGPTTPGGRTYAVVGMRTSGSVADLSQNTASLPVGNYRGQCSHRPPRWHRLHGQGLSHQKWLADINLYWVNPSAASFTAPTAPGFQHSLGRGLDDYIFKMIMDQRATSIICFANVSIKDIPAAPTAGNGGAVCAGATLSLTASTVSGATYAWTGPAGFTSALQNPTRPSATTAMTGTYSVTVTVAGCTSAAGTTAATVNAIPAAPTAGNGGAVCAGSTLSLTASTVSGATYAWTGPASFTSALQNPTRPSATTAMTGTYSVTVTVAGCTSAAGTTAATVNAIPAAPTAGNGGPVCAGSTLSLTASTVSGATYAWTGPASFTSAAPESDAAQRDHRDDRHLQRDGRRCAVARPPPGPPPRRSMPFLPRPPPAMAGRSARVRL